MGWFRTLVATALGLLTILSTIGGVEDGIGALRHEGIWEPLVANAAEHWPFWLIVIATVAYFRHICITEPMKKRKRQYRHEQEKMRSRREKKR